MTDFDKHQNNVTVVIYKYYYKHTDNKHRLSEMQTFINITPVIAHAS
jgi:hypothetical protein